MLSKDKLSRKDYRFFIIPFIGLTIMFAVLTYSTTTTRIDEIHRIIEEASLNIAESYSDALINFSEAQDITIDLLTEKILVASEAMLAINNNPDSQDISELARKLRVDQICIYNSNAEVIATNIDILYGWQAHPGHPVYNYIMSGERSLVEDIRADTVDGLYYKFGYLRREDNTFVQIGVLAEKVYEFTNKFEIQRLIDNIVAKEDIMDALFIDPDNNIVAHSFDSLESASTNNHIPTDLLTRRDAFTEKHSHDGIEVLHISTPIYNGSDYLGILTIIWPNNLVAKEVNEIVMNSIFGFLITMLVISAILMFAYRNNRANLKSAYYDKLTALPNSLYLEEYLEDKVLKNSKSNKAILMLNCTNFRILNMTYGFKYGDNRLIQMADNLKKSLEPNEMLFRFNSDRFIVVVDEYKSQRELFERCKILVDRIRGQLNDSNKNEYLSAQASIFEINNSDISADKILQDLSLALSSIDRSLKYQIAFFNNNMELDVRRKDLIEKVLKDVIAGKDKTSFYLYYQPILDLKNNNIVRVEALSRLDIEGIGSISPYEFIELAEKRMLIYELGIHIISLACDFANRLKAYNYEGARVAINISLIQLLREEFIDDIIKILNDKKIEGSLLEFEITESVIVENINTINQKLIEIKNLGITFSLDDFGTGYSSFARLHDVHIDTVKIDRYFIDRLDKFDADRLITEDIISMSHKMGLSVVAEGVENEEQLKYLITHGCDYVQGYHISKPLEFTKAISFIENYEKG